ncbi:hypothetical protein FOA52_010226 [Chlamydomonas sp. UWO 241]|nr:hypothetical protein FOA52_010226 [Chlamydomonas sp. UWO 241]
MPVPTPVLVEPVNLYNFADGAEMTTSIEFASNAECAAQQAVHDFPDDFTFNAIPDDSTDYGTHACKGFYVRTDCTGFADYEFRQGMNAEGNNMAINVNTAPSYYNTAESNRMTDGLARTAGACSQVAGCQGFNGNGYLKVVPGCRVTCPQYADDCMPLLRSCAPAAVAALVEAMAVFGRATGLVLNLGKCGILPLGSAGEGLLAGAEVAGLRVLDAGVSLGVPVSAGLPPPEAVTGVCRVAAAASRWVRAGVWAVVAALVVDAMERGCRHLWRITRPRDGVLPPDRTVSVERAGALATMDLWNALASFAEGGVMPRGWAGVVGPTHPYVGVVDGKLILNKAS